MFSSSYLIFSAINYLLKSTYFFKKRITNRVLAIFCGHFSFGLIILSISINILYESKLEFNGKKGEYAANKDLKAILKDIRFARSKNYYRQIAEFSVQDANNHKVVLKPENRFYMVENVLSQEADIFSYISHDLYGIMSKVDNETIHAEIYYKPMMSFI